jgi:hypothetical protein
MAYVRTEEEEVEFKLELGSIASGGFARYRNLSIVPAGTFLIRFYR